MMLPELLALWHVALAEALLLVALLVAINGLDDLAIDVLWLMMPRRQRHRTDDRHRNADQQRTGRCHHQHRQKPQHLATQRPSQQGYGHRQGRVPSAQLIAQTAQLRTALFGIAHHLHDFRVTRSQRRLLGANGQSTLAINSSRQHQRTRRLGQHIGFAGQVGLIHA